MKAGSRIIDSVMESERTKGEVIVERKLLEDKLVKFSMMMVREHEL